MKKKKETTVPKHARALLWSHRNGKIDLAKDAPVIIHNILALGTMRDIKWLFKKIPAKTVRRIFHKFPLNVYTKASFLFASETLLRIRNRLSPKRYVKTLY